MSEPIDVYCDQFQMSTGPYGATLSFLISEPMPPAPGSSPKTQRLATIRMSLEHLKTMAFVLRNQVRNHEQQTGTTIQIPVQVLNSLKIAPEDWEAFWKKD